MQLVQQPSSLLIALSGKGWGEVERLEDLETVETAETLDTDQRYNSVLE